MPSPFNITNIPAPRVDFIDPRTGLMAREWYRFFFNLFNLTGAGKNETSLSDLQVGPPVYDLAGIVKEQSDASVLAGQVSGIESQFAEIEKRIQGLEAEQKSSLFLELVKDLEGLQSAPPAYVVNELEKRIDALESMPVAQGITEAIKRIEALECAPVSQVHVKKAAYGSFYDTTTQTAAAINTAYAMTFNSTDLSFGCYVGSPTSRVYVDSTSIYNIQFSAQLDNTSGGDHAVYIWLRINGTDVSNSAGQIQVKNNNGYVIAAWNYVQFLKSNDYFEIMWAVSDTAVRILAQAAAAPVPAIPSVILTVTDNILAQVDHG
jgi:hypothetical protein